MKKIAIASVVGFLVGIIFFGVAGFLAAPGMMIVEDESKLGFEETVQAILDSAKKNNWKVPKVYKLHKTLAKDGIEVLPVAVIELCHPEHAGRVLESDGGRVVSSLMPCRLSVYKTSDGKVIVSRMNSGLVAKAFGGVIAEVMAQASAENEEILSVVLP